jgi:acetolactate synthase-1/2/3 large subunit
LVEQLKALGVDTVFGLPGGAVGPVFDALLDEPRLRVVHARHEAGATFAAAGYAWATQRPAAVLVTSGPGALNCMTGIAAARCDGLPVIIIAGEVSRQSFGKGALQEGSPYHLNVAAMARCAAKASFDVPSAESLPGLLRHAYEIATSGRQGPVFLSLPLDVSLAPVRRQGIVAAAPPARLVPDGGVVARAARSISGAARPVIVAGSGCRWGDGPRALRTLAERTQIPVLTTPKAKGVFPESHPLALGVFGYGGHSSATAFLAEANPDVVLAVGTGLSDPSTDGWSPLLQAADHLIQIDIDPSQIGRVYPVSVGLIGPADEVLDTITAALPATAPTRQFGVKRATFEQGAGERLSPVDALRWIQAQLPADTLFTCDIGEHLLFAIHTLNIDHPRAFLSMIGLGSMGSALPAALGAHVGTGRPVCAICGDGGFLMSVSEIATAVGDGVPMTTVVLDDNRFGMVEVGQQALYGRSDSFGCSEDVAAVARGLGAAAFTATPANLDEAAAFLARPLRGPRVLHVPIDRSVRMPRNNRLQQLLFSGEPMERP